VRLSVGTENVAMVFDSRFWTFRNTKRQPAPYHQEKKPMANMMFLLYH